MSKNNKTCLVGIVIKNGGNDLNFSLPQLCDPGTF